MLNKLKKVLKPTIAVMVVVARGKEVLVDLINFLFDDKEYNTTRNLPSDKYMYNKCYKSILNDDDLSDLQKTDILENMHGNLSDAEYENIISVLDNDMSSFNKVRLINRIIENNE